MLNKNKPHDIVYGVPGVGYVQNGISYKPNGEPVEVIRRKVKQDDGSHEIMEMAKDPINEPEEVPEEVVETAEPILSDPVEDQMEADSIPDFITEVPARPKYPSQMNKTECLQELQAKNVECSETMLVKELQAKVAANR